MRSKALFSEQKNGPKWGPNRIFDAEAFRKPLGGLLERSWNPPEPKKNNTEALLPRHRRIPRPISGPKRDGGEIRHLNCRWITGVPSSFSGRKNQDGKPRKLPGETKPDISKHRPRTPYAPKGAVADISSKLMQPITQTIDPSRF